jgi:hypothetical protein
MSNTLDEKVRAPSDDDKSARDTTEGYGALPADPDAGLSAEERAAIVSLTSIGLNGTDSAS